METVYVKDVCAIADTGVLDLHQSCTSERGQLKSLSIAAWTSPARRDRASIESAVIMVYNNGAEEV